jgi:two-component sensor histidine kinase
MMIATTKAGAAKSATREDRETLLRELDDRVRNNLSLLLALVKLHMDHPPASVMAALSRISGQIMALATIYDMTREGGAIGESRNAAELYTRLISAIERDLAPLGKIRFTADSGTVEIPIKAATTLAIVLGELLFDAIDRASEAGKAPEISVNLDYQGHCRFTVRIADKAPSDGERLSADTLAHALGGELRTKVDASGTERELIFDAFEPDGSCAAP